MLHPKAIVESSRKGGLGIFALEPIAAGTVVWWPCPCCSIFRKQTIHEMSVKKRGWLEEYGYHSVGQDIIVPCHNAHLLNHSCEPNVIDYGLDFGLAVCDIPGGEEIAIDYRTFVDDPSWTVTCACGTSSCVHEVRPEQGLNPRVIAGWRKRLEPVLPRIGTVTQPHHAELILASSIYATLRGMPQNFAWQDYITIRRPGFMSHIGSEIAHS